jgi:hypothetical protein
MIFLVLLNFLYFNREFHASAAMSQDHPLTNEKSRDSCRLCGGYNEQMYGQACAKCVEETLLNHLPLLKQALEAKYGAALDRWLVVGRFKEAQWIFGSDVHLCRERLSNFLRELVWEAVSKREIELSLPLGQSWSTTEARPFLNSVQKQCQEDILNLLGSLFLAITKTPTEEAERELIEVVTGKRRVNKWHVREEAITALVTTKGTSLSLPARALIALRYRVDGGKFPYASLRDGRSARCGESYRRRCRKGWTD